MCVGKVCENAPPFLTRVSSPLFGLISCLQLNLHKCMRLGKLQ